MTAWYNEIDHYAADWLENLIKLGEIAPGIVDRRSIEDVRPDELNGFTQCHFFAGIGVWSKALRLAGWPDNRPVWTGSCPCQPFSAAGKGAGVADERHLWPAWDWLIEYGKPGGVLVLGEQVASSDGLAWLDIVSSDLEGKAHACWPYDLCAAGFGSPNIRQRLFFAGIPGAGVALGDTEQPRLEGHGGHGGDRDQPGRIGADAAGPVAEAGAACGVEHAEGHGWQQRGPESGERSPAAGCGAGGLADTSRSGGGAGLCHKGSTGQRWSVAPDHRCNGRLANANGGNTGAERKQPGGEQRFEPADGCLVRLDHGGRPGPVNGLWTDADWIFCRDGKWRAIESGTFPLVDGAAFKLGSGSAYEGKSRAGMLKGYGNAINAETAAGFIACVMQELGV